MYFRFMNRYHATIRKSVPTNGRPGLIGFSDLFSEEMKQLCMVLSCHRLLCSKAPLEKVDADKSPNSVNNTDFRLPYDKAYKEARKERNRKAKAEQYKMYRKKIRKNETDFRNLMGELGQHEYRTGPASFSAPFTVDKGNGSIELDFDLIPKVEKTEEYLHERSKLTYAILLSYCGFGYHGLQINNTVPTIEGEILRAMVELELAPESCFRTPQLIEFQRAARTDKGVSACRQVINMRLPIREGEGKAYVDIINAKLPETIRVMDIVRTTRNFNAKNSCEARTYSYLTPTFAFAPIDRVVNDNYRISEEVLDHVRNLLSCYEGMQNFHNFTIKKKATDQDAQRVIISIECGEPFERDGLEWVHIKLKGQSFMMHQIRKMLGLVMCVCRGIAPPSIMGESLSHTTVETPKAPGLGLVLEQPHYPKYDRKQFKNHERMDWSGPGVGEKVSAFRRDVIDLDIVTREVKERSMFSFICLLHRYSFTEENSGLRMAQRLLNDASEDDLELGKRLLLGEATPHYRSKRQTTTRET